MLISHGKIILVQNSQEALSLLVSGEDVFFWRLCDDSFFSFGILCLLQLVLISFWISFGHYFHYLFAVIWLYRQSLTTRAQSGTISPKPAYFKV